MEEMLIFMGGEVDLDRDRPDKPPSRCAFDAAWSGRQQGWLTPVEHDDWFRRSEEVVPEEVTEATGDFSSDGLEHRKCRLR
jgi:hypothetical protein